MHDIVPGPLQAAPRKTLRGSITGTLTAWVRKASVTSAAAQDDARRRSTIILNPRTQVREAGLREPAS
jgi:hypothetical protein